MAPVTIPVLVVAGFLGSGKTTLLNHLLRATTGLRIGVIVNDFGRINIDAMTVAAQVDSMVTLGNGCLCCAVDVEDLDEMLGRLAKPDAPVDVIVIEASGLAEPPAMVRLVLGSTNPHIGYGGLVEVVDAAEFESTRERHPQLDKHLRYADLVVLNKIDRVATHDRVLALVRDLAGGVPVVATEHGRVDPGLLFDPVDRPARHQLSFEDLIEPEPHLHAGYESVEFTSAEPMNPLRFMDFLHGRPAGLYRMKGVVVVGDQRLRLHTVGAQVRFHRDAHGDTTRLVMIGAGLDGAALIRDLRQATESDPAGVDPLALLSVTRYLVD
ncbi:CobW family GTP-binding protein [Actinokineospora sp.]|uniref:CobW family GTP-binding protein n=1 Tax=Actinokineospora sp. TaxID=1872133 RepID=UPI004038011F